METLITVHDFDLDADRLDENALHYDNEAHRFYINSLHLQYLRVFVGALDEDLEFDKMTSLVDADGNEYGRVSGIVYRALPDDPHISLSLRTDELRHERMRDVVSSIADGDLHISE